jgi:hypothetical protein
MSRLPGQPGRSLPGTTKGDSEPTVVPAPRHRAVQVFVGGRRSYYLPVPLAVDGDVLLPAADLAKQLGLKVETTEGGMTLSRDDVTLRLLADGQVLKGDEPLALSPAPQSTAEAVMVPARAVSGLFKLPAEWDAEKRVLRLGGS